MNESQDRKNEPSMEEIFASIRRVVTSDPKLTASSDEKSTVEAVMVNEKNEIINLNPMAKYTTDVAAPALDPQPDHATSDDAVSASLVHPQSDHRAEPDLGVGPDFKATLDPALDSFMSSASISVTLKDWLDQNLPDLVEQRLRGLLRPLLKSWFDSNLPTMIDRIVRTEVERIVSHSADR
ncbi:MAG: DUF2497 domain-containing protein [Alphaproteobacteria bacterium]